MAPFAKYKFLLSSTAYLILLNLGCNTNNSVKNPVEPYLPNLTDSIPFDKLGQGKLVFGRDWPFNVGIYVIDIDHRRTWAIKIDGCHNPMVSPDGRRIAYSGLSDLGIQDIYITDIDGRSKMHVTDIVGQEFYPSWTFDGKQIIFSSFGVNNTLREPLYIQSPVPKPVDRVQINEDLFVSGRVSASSEGKLAFVSYGGIWTMNIDGSNLKPVLTVAYPPRQLISPAWSPDGQKIALISLLIDSSYSAISMDIGLISSEGGNPDVLITLPVSPQTSVFYSLCWSPDGSKIAFNRHDSAEETHIYLINRDGTGLTQVTTAEWVMDASLSWSH
jgi:Tol biopolymer transport system component